MLNSDGYSIYSLRSKYPVVQNYDMRWLCLPAYYHVLEQRLGDRVVDI